MLVLPFAMNFFIILELIALTCKKKRLPDIHQKNPKKSKSKEIFILVLGLYYIHFEELKIDNKTNFVEYFGEYIRVVP
jgi:hypothetical protein